VTNFRCSVRCHICSINTPSTTALQSVMEILKEEATESNGKRKLEEESDALQLSKQEGEGHLSGLPPSGKWDDNQIVNGSVIVPVVEPKLRYITLKTGLCYDVRMRYHAKIFTSYFEYIDPHPEDPRRIYRIYKILAENGLITDPTLSGIDQIGDYMLKIPVREATAEEILLVHSEEHLKFIESTSSMSRERLLEETEKGDSVYFNHDSLLSAKLSCGGAIEACKAVVEGRVKNALAVVRPPGHHAEPDSPGGFCLFSNVAVAAKNILRNYPESVRKIVVLDWDVHHGNGTQKAFWEDPRVLYISLHRYEQGKYYPGTKAGGADQCGENEGLGKNINIPWPVGGMNDADYLYAFRKVVMPVCREYAPDLLIISSGFDAAEGDIIGGCHISPAGYSQMTHMLKSLARGNVCVVLEGGYNLDSIANSALSVTKVLLGESPEEPKVTVPSAHAIEVIDDVIKIQSQYWKTLQPAYTGICFTNPSIMGNYSLLVNPATEKKVLSDLAVNPRLCDAVRNSQAQYLSSKFGFINLPVVSGKGLTSPSLDNQVLSTKDIFQANTIIIVIHDPSDVWARQDPRSGLLDLSGSMIVDTSSKFVEWAVNLKYGVIDINVPLTLTGKDDETYNNVTASQELLLYIWDNYIQYFPVTKIALVGFGDAYNGVIHLCGHREVRSIVKASINFLDRTPLRAIVSSIDESVTDWFYKNSLVFTSTRHPCWGEQGTSEMKRPRKKYGRVLKADIDGLPNIVDERFEETTDFILDSIEEYEDESSN